MNKISHIMLALNARIPATPKDGEVQRAFSSLSLAVSKVASEGGWSLVTGVARLSELSPDGVGSLMLKFLDQGFSVSLTRHAGILISWHHYIDPNHDAFNVSREERFEPDEMPSRIGVSMKLGIRLRTFTPCAAHSMSSASVSPRTPNFVAA